MCSNQIGRKAVVSHYRTPEIDAMFEDWRTDSKEVPLYLKKTRSTRRDEIVVGLYMNF